MESSCTVRHKLSLFTQCETKAVTTMVGKLIHNMAVKKVDEGMWRRWCYIAAEFHLILTEEQLCIVLQTKMAMMIWPKHKDTLISMVVRVKYWGMVDGSGKKDRNLLANIFAKERMGGKKKVGWKWKPFKTSSWTILVPMVWDVLSYRWKMLCCVVVLVLAENWSCDQICTRWKLDYKPLRA